MTQLGAPDGDHPSKDAWVCGRQGQSESPVSTAQHGAARAEHTGTQGRGVGRPAPLAPLVVLVLVAVAVFLVLIARGTPPFTLPDWGWGPLLRVLAFAAAGREQRERTHVLTSPTGVCVSCCWGVADQRVESTA